MVKLYYVGGRSPFEDIHAYVQRAKKRYPGITDHGVNQLVKRSIDLLVPRQKRLIIPFWGRDILTEDLASTWYWPIIMQKHRSRLLAHPLTGGLTIASDDDADRKIALLSSRDYHKINRSVLVCSHSGRQLQQTVVFCAATGWEQEMSDADAAVLLSYPQIRHLLVREDAFHGYRPIQSYSQIPVRERITAPNMNEAMRVMKHFERSRHHTGVDVPKERT